MKPAIYNFSIKQGDTFTLKMQYTTKATPTSTPVPVNMTGYSVAAMIRGAQDTSSALLATFTTVITSPTEGKYELRLTATQTAALNFSVGYHDIQVTASDGTKLTLLQGRVTLNKEVTNV